MRVEETVQDVSNRFGGHIVEPLCARSSADIITALENSGVLDGENAAQLHHLIEATSEPLDVVIVRLGFVSEKRIAESYAAIADLPYRERLNVDASSLDKLPAINAAFLQDQRVVPLTYDGETLSVAVADPFLAAAKEGLEFATQKTVSLVVTTASEIDRLLTEHFSNAQQAGEFDDNTSIDIGDDAARLKDMASGEPAVRLVNSLISTASRTRASDIHLEPIARGCVVRHRIDGELLTVKTLPKRAGLAAISRLKILSQLDIAEQRRPQDGRMSFAIDGRAIDLRLSTNPTVHGESLVIRLLDQDAAPLDLTGLGFSGPHADLLKRFIAQPNGMILLTGPTGSGKTTTLYTLLSMLTDGKRKILTIEDPVEYKLDGVNQTQVNPAIDLGFANALRSFLRHDPDVIMVGEMRDLETARIAMRAALTGHLVLSTLHTNSAAAAITRLLDMGVEDYLIASTLLGVVGQRLVKRRCSACSKDNVVPLKASPCTACHGTGFAGRIVIAEAIEIDGVLREAIKIGASEQAIAHQAEQAGMVSMKDDGLAKAQQAFTTEAEVIAAAGRL